MMSKPGKKLLGRFAAVDPEGFKRGLEAFQGLPLGGPDSPWWKLLEQLGIDPVNVEFLIAVIEQGKWKDSTAPCLYIWQAVHRRAGDRYRDSLSHITGVTGQRRPDADGRTICFADCAKGSMCSEDIKPRGGRRGRDGLFRDVTGERAERAWGKRLAKWRLDDLDVLVTRQDISRATKRGTLALRSLDNAEKQVVIARARRVSRKQFLKTAPTEKERKARQAAWQRVHRKGILPALHKRLWEYIRNHPHYADDDWWPDPDYSNDFGVGGGWRTPKSGPHEPDEPYLSTALAAHQRER